MDYSFEEGALSNYKRVKDRNVDELLGLCKGIVADGMVNTKEAIFLQKWLNTVPNFADEWPFNVLIKRLYRYLDGNALDEEEQSELFKLLQSLIGGDKDYVTDQIPATTLLFDTPEPDIEFRFKNFCITGKCVSGARKQGTS